MPFPLWDALASLIGDYVPLSTQRSIEKAILNLREELDRLHDRVDFEGVNKDEFTDLFKSSYLAIVSTTNEEKLRAVSAILVNLLLKPGDSDKLSYTELDHFVRCLDQLSVGAVTALGVVYNLGRKNAPLNYSDGDIRRSLEALRSVQGIRLDFHVVHSEMRAMDPSLLMGLLGELNAANLIHLPGVPTVRTPDFGNYPVELTALGIRFVERVLKGKKEERSGSN
ncbi:MAG TPA: hypothetical protein VGQ08_08970 [Nitrospiraceae bacterium]|jgi:hypothetical protein|nr:hypothetical protein [Nitrospiraceae bacterium]